MSYIIQCDRCSKTGERGQNGTHVPQEWMSVRLTLKETGVQYFNWHQFCPDCIEYLDLKTDPVEETSAEKLVAILESMADEAVEERAT